MDQGHQTAIETLYSDVVTLGDKARGWFDGPGVAWRAALPVADRAAVATESLAITARLMAVMAWVLDPAHDVGAPARRLAIDPAADGPMPAVLQGQAGGDIALASRQLVARAEALATRVAA
jgi:regulator of CtrA degradation